MVFTKCVAEAPKPQKMKESSFFAKKNTCLRFGAIFGKKPCLTNVGGQVRGHRSKCRSLVVFLVHHFVFLTLWWELCRLSNFGEFVVPCTITITSTITIIVVVIQINQGIHIIVIVIVLVLNIVIVIVIIIVLVLVQVFVIVKVKVIVK